MLDFLKSNPAVSMLKEDHVRVKDLFDQFAVAKSKSAKTKIVRLALTELKVHAAIEEELFYPAVRRPIGKEIMNEADEEHHVAKMLIAELDGMDGSESHFEAKFHVLAENVRHHIKEEENEMLPKAKGVKLNFDALAEKMMARKEKLLADGVPSVGEETMVKASRGKAIHPRRQQSGSLRNSQNAGREDVPPSTVVDVLMGGIGHVFLRFAASMLQNNPPCPRHRPTPCVYVAGR